MDSEMDVIQDAVAVRLEDIRPAMTDARRQEALDEILRVLRGVNERGEE